MIFKKTIFWVHLFRGPIGEYKIKIQQISFQHLLNLVLGKVKKKFRVLAITVPEQLQKLEIG